jgi:glycyl-tRNA synthetase
VGLDSAIIMNPAVWRAAGHVEQFADPMAQCKACRHRFRVDSQIEAKLGDGVAFDRSLAGLNRLQQEHQLCCPSCSSADVTDVRMFNMLFRTHVGALESEADEVYLRPETAQGIFVNFAHVVRSSRMRLPFGIAQAGKSFRNELHPSNFLFRVREFEQMELEFFCTERSASLWHDYWVQFCYRWLLHLGLRSENLRLRKHAVSELAHYAKATTDIEYRFPFGWGELWGIANRGDYDLRQHSLHSKHPLSYAFPENPKETFFPHVIEPALGLDRLVYALLADAYVQAPVELRPGAKTDSQADKDDDAEDRTTLRLAPGVAPYQFAVLPLLKKAPLVDKAAQVFQTLLGHGRATSDVAASIGRRYRRQDEIGTPYCITVDHASLRDGTVTIRERDSMQQRTLPISELDAWAAEVRRGQAFKPELSLPMGTT